VVTYNRVFVVGQSKEISDWKGLTALPWQPILAKISKKSHKNGRKFSCVWHIHAEFPFEMLFLAVSKLFTCDTLVHEKGLLPWQPVVGLGKHDFGTKIAINAFLRGITRIWLLITRGFRGWPIWVINAKLECEPMSNVMAALPNIGGTLCSVLQSLADVH